jgi:uncharacterized protein YbaA (DUF1428 family)
MGYVDGFVLPIPRKNLRAHASISRKAGRIWREHGALDYKECVGDDLKPKGMAPLFSKMARVRPGETVVFSWILFKSRAHRDRANARVMKDPRLNEMMDPKAMPFDVKRMAYAGFRILVDL